MPEDNPEHIGNLPAHPVGCNCAGHCFLCSKAICVSQSDDAVLCLDCYLKERPASENDPRELIDR